MKALDFEYDGKKLSEKNYIVCNFNYSNGVTEVNLGTNISFSKVSRNSGKKYGLTGTKYEECVTTTFDICKDPEKHTSDKMEITDSEFRNLAKWLNRREFLKFRMIDGTGDISEDTCYFNASFNLTKLTIGETLYGVRLTMETDSPFGYGQECSFEWDITTGDTVKEILNSSSEIGYLNPKVEITLPDTLTGTVNVSIKNTLAENEICNTEIRNCSAGEIITMDSETQIITSNNPDHKIYDDFNYDFFIIGNTFSDEKNEITVSSSSPCKIKISYCPVIKDVP